MNDNLKSLKSKFRESFFVIPDYQRGYSWTKEQLNDFFDDLIIMQENEQHYTGMLTLEKFSEDDWENERFENYKWLKGDCEGYYVVDGQQRLTTCIILINEIYKLFQKYAPDERIDNDRQIEVKEIFLSRIQDDKKPITIYKLISIDKEINEYFKRNIIENENDEKISKSLYTNNLDYAKKFFNDKLLEIYDTENPNNKNYDDKGIKGIKLLYKKLTTGLVFNTYEITPNNSNVYVAFESMNNRGKNLSNLEILKNRLIYLCNLWEIIKNKDILKENNNFENNEMNKKRIDDNKLYAKNVRNQINNTWKCVYKMLGKNGEQLDDDEYLRCHWIIYFGYSRSKLGDSTITYNDYLLRNYFSPKRILKFVDNVEKNGDTEDSEESLIKELEKNLTIQDISNYVQSLESFIYSWYNVKASKYKLSELLLKKENDRSDEEKKQIEINSLLTKINRLDVGHFNPLITVVLQAKDIEMEKKIEFLETLERYIFLFYKLGNNSSNINDSFDFNLAHMLYKKIDNCNIENIIMHYKKIDFIDKNGYIDISKGILAKFQKLYDKKGYYTWGNSLKYFLLEYDNSIKKNIDNVTRINPDTLYTKKDTIEHIYPETPSEKWQKIFEEYEEREKHILMHSLGNLLILIAPANSQLQNKPYEDKVKERYNSGSQSEIEVSQKYEQWNEKSILQRGLELLDYMSKNWDFKFKDDRDKIKMLGLEFLLTEEQLKEKTSENFLYDFDDDEKEDGSKNKKIKSESFSKFYEGAKLIYFNKENYSKIKKSIVEETGEKENSTDVYISAAIGMFSGEEFLFGIRIEAIEYYLNRIFSEYDVDIQKNALQSLDKHIAIRAKYGNVKKIKEVFEKYLEKM